MTSKGDDRNGDEEVLRIGCWRCSNASTKPASSSAFPNTFSTVGNTKEQKEDKYDDHSATVVDDRTRDDDEDTKDEEHDDEEESGGHTRVRAMQVEKVEEARQRRIE